MTNEQGLTDFHQTSLRLQCIILFIRLTKNANGDCKLAVETLQDSNLSSKTKFFRNKVALFLLSKFQWAIPLNRETCTPCG